MLPKHEKQETQPISHSQPAAVRELRAFHRVSVNDVYEAHVAGRGSCEILE